jgi:excisionase family DNA binding protein
MDAPDRIVSLETPLLTAKQVAQLLNVPTSSIYEYSRRQLRPMPSVQVGRHRRYYRADLEAWLAGEASR